MQEGLAQLLGDLEADGQVELEARTIGGYFGERPLTEEQMEAVSDTLSINGFSVATVYVIYKGVEGHRALTPPPTPESPDLSAESLRALSIKQPFAEQILRGEKNIESRSWQVKRAGPLLLHASNTKAELEAFDDADITPDALPYGALVGVVDVVQCLWNEEEERYGWLLAHPRRLAQPPSRTRARPAFSAYRHKKFRRR